MLSANCDLQMYFVNIMLLPESDRPNVLYQIRKREVENFKIFIQFEASEIKTSLQKNDEIVHATFGSTFVMHS